MESLNRRSFRRRVQPAIAIGVAALGATYPASGVITGTSSADAATHGGGNRIAAPSRVAGSTVARLVHPELARARPGAGRVVDRLGAGTSWSHEPQVLLVLGSARHGGREWLRVLLPVRPVGATGWIPRDVAVLHRDEMWIEVDKSARRLMVYRDDRLVRETRAVIGAPATPTPGGLAAIYERNRQPQAHGFLGPWVLALTALSNVLHHFDGGPGRIAIHGRSGASLNDPLGSARSDGCIRIPDRTDRWLAAHAPFGTPVRISS